MLGGKQRLTMSLAQVNDAYQAMRESARKAERCGPLNFAIVKPEGDGFRALPSDLTGLSDQAIETYMLHYQGWLEYYMEVLLEMEGNRDIADSRCSSVEGVVSTDLRDSGEMSATEASKGRSTKSTAAYVQAFEEYIEAKQMARKAVMVVAILQDRLSRFSRIIELRKRNLRTLSGEA